MLKSLELCAGAGGQALGLEKAGFEHMALVEIDPFACATLRHNRPTWNVVEGDVRAVRGTDHVGIDLLAAGVPCPPFSIAGKQLGHLDDRDLFPQVLRIAEESSPSAILVENVPGLLESRFKEYRARVEAELNRLGYDVEWAKLNAADFGVPQLRPRALMVALPADARRYFRWPQPTPEPPATVGTTLLAEMASGGWEGSAQWAKRASAMAPTLVGGSKKHGGPDLGPTRARRAWAKLGVDGKALADAPPPAGFTEMPRLTVKMAAILQGFPLGWEFVGTKTQAYRQVGNAFPPPVARAVGEAIRNALRRAGEPAESPRQLALSLA